MATNNNKPSPALGLKPPPLDLTKIRPLPKYAEVFILQSVFCENCKSILAPNGIAWAIDLPQIETMGEQLHENGVRANKILCAQPGLLISYGIGRLQGDLLK